MGVIHQKNQLMVKMLWASLLLGIVASFTSGKTEMLLTLVGVGSVLSGILSLLVWRKLFIQATMYFSVISLSILTYFLVLGDPHITSSLMMFYVLIIVALYQDYRPILFSGFIQVLLAIYFYIEYKETVFTSFRGNQDLISLIVYIVLITGLLVFQTRFSNKLRKQVDENLTEIEAAKNEAENVLNQIKTTVTVLKEFGTSLHNNMSITGKISNEVAVTFSDISNTIDNQGRSVNEINQSIVKSNRNMEQVAIGSEKVRDLSNQTVSATRNGRVQLSELSNEMDQVNSIINTAVQTMSKLNEQNKEVEEILTTITSIAEQTNLLALNAAIESARAGEHGKGFAVVADEVRKLAEHSRVSTEHIASIIQNTMQMTQTAVQQVSSGQHAVVASKEKTNLVTGIFDEVSNNAEQVVSQVNQTDNIIQQLKAHSNLLVKEIEMITSSTKETTVSVQEVVAGVEEQNLKINDTVDSVEKLDELILKLTKLSK